MTVEKPPVQEPKMPAKGISQSPQPAETQTGTAASALRKGKPGPRERTTMAEKVRDLERENKELLVRVRELELERFDSTKREHAEDVTPSSGMSGENILATSGPDLPDEKTAVGQDLAAVTTPAKFALHAAFYYAGRVADKVVSLYSRALKLDRGYVADFNKTTGLAHARHGHWEKAVPLLEKALAMTPHDQELRMDLAKAYGALGQYEEACHHLEEILRTDPDSAQPLRALGLIYCRKQDYEQAVEYLERAVKLDPSHTQTHYRLGTAYDNTKRYDRAVESFQMAIALDPRFAKAYQAMGFTYESMGDRESAVDCFKKALELE